MDRLADTLNRIDTITFDCYGTLIDWHAGLLEAFGEMFGPAAMDQADRLCDLYRRIEAAVEAEPFRCYREVLAEVSRRLARQIGVELPAGGDAILAARLPTWKPFADTNDALGRLAARYRLGVLSNVDRDLFAGTAEQFSVPFDVVITAEDVRAYKPSHAHFRKAVEAVGRDKLLHVAESLYHDGGPANTLQIAFVWLNRYKVNATGEVHPPAELTDLASLAALAGV